jgi:hypothetical protein
LRRSASAVARSSGSLPAIAVSSSAASRTLVVIGPGVSWLWLIGTTCMRLSRPTVGLSPTMPLTLAGQVIEPSVSVPIAAQASPAATAAPLPDDEPQGLRSIACGFLACPPTALHPDELAEERMLAHSDKLALPRITTPSARSRATIGASRPVTLPLSARLPAVVGSRSRVSMLSLTRIALPASGPAKSATASAWRKASGLIASTASNCGPWSSIASIRWRYAAT